MELEFFARSISQKGVQTTTTGKQTFTAHVREPHLPWRRGWHRREFEEGPRGRPGLLADPHPDPRAGGGRGHLGLDGRGPRLRRGKGRAGAEEASTHGRERPDEHGDTPPLDAPGQALSALSGTPTTPCGSGQSAPRRDLGLELRPAKRGDQVEREAARRGAAPRGATTMLSHEPTPPGR